MRSLYNTDYTLSSAGARWFSFLFVVTCAYVAVLVHTGDRGGEQDPVVRAPVTTSTAVPSTTTTTTAAPSTDSTPDSAFRLGNTGADGPASTGTTFLPESEPAAQPLVAPEQWETSSTMYSPCSAGDTMANGEPVREGSVAVSNENYDRLLGSRWRVMSGPNTGREYTVRDRGSRAHFDMWTPDCAEATEYGLHYIAVERIE